MLGKYCVTELQTWFCHYLTNKQTKGTSSPGWGDVLTFSRKCRFLQTKGTSSPDWRDGAGLKQEVWEISSKLGGSVFTILYLASPEWQSIREQTKVLGTLYDSGLEVKPLLSHIHCGADSFSPK